MFRRASNSRNSTQVSNCPQIEFKHEYDTLAKISGISESYLAAVVN